ncbi:response regulator transcription factor [Alkaliphilus peptidifermentans]|uniref:Stage 0 sporulation protein A homolog n=1 Tax=Alkaliphilus peptidifermentans DSM 18978 TaxID=1120976 RepID=A0A1G5JGM4_9FIRM|nr:response regulator transcription factor [Alkaliphilus peptidifermentans]SCY87061.1 DNA-binding response regulator, OmpR family, contains REC and winged-helix (wHTH) domain [Alkaliphilus peptidifermentans DSM 18978]
MNILLVDDERLLVKGLKKSLEQEGFNVTAAYDGNEAFNVFSSTPFDFVILDLMLPEIDGITLCKMIREKSDVPIIMLTAKDSEIDKVLGLELGADDYMTKPFNTRELLARIRAIGRRLEKQTQKEAIYTVMDLELNLNLRQVKLKGKEIDLTPKEFDILALLIHNRGRVYSREQIFQLIWKEPCFDTRTIDVHIKNLREKLKDNQQKSAMIQTKWGVGYFFRRD